MISLLVDITDILNTLNLKLQSRHQMLPSLMIQIFVFESKLDLFIIQLKKSNYTHFPKLFNLSQDNLEIIQQQNFYSYLEALRLEFPCLFNEIRNFTPLMSFIENPFKSDLSIVSETMNLIRGDESQIQLEIIELQYNIALIDKHKDATPTESWMSYVPSEQFPQIHKGHRKVLTMFGSPYVREAGFSAMTKIKSRK